MYSDTYITPGNYYCNTDIKAKTLKNCPFSNAFVLKVDFATGEGYPRQTFINCGTNRMYRRTYDSHQKLWTGEASYITNSDLFKTSSGLDLNNITNDYYCGVIINPVNSPFASGQTIYFINIPGNSSDDLNRAFQMAVHLGGLSCSIRCRIIFDNTFGTWIEK